MKLDVLNRSTDTQPWYADGLKFTCSQCGNCCTGAPGYVWISDEEIERVASHLRLSVDETIARYCRKVGGRYSLKEARSPQGLYDCIFLKETRIGRGRDARVKRVCTVYPVRPLQCRTWPFWDGNLGSKSAWEAAGEGCHRLNAGAGAVTREQGEGVRGGEGWAGKPPTPERPHASQY